MSDEANEPKKPLEVLPPPPHFSPEPVSGQSQQGADDSQTASKKKLSDRPVALAVISSVISAIASTLLTLLFTMILPSAYQLPVKLEGFASSIESLEESVKSLDADIRAESEKRTQAIDKLQLQINDIYKAYGIRADLRPADEMVAAIENDYVLNNLVANSNIELRATATIAYSIITGEEYTAGQLADQKLLLPYISELQEEVFFYGQISENGRWDGDCIINVYKDNKLTFIRDAKYDDGYLVSSKAVFSYEIKNGQYVWAISDRTNNGDYSSGETALYAWKSDFEQAFTFDEVSPANILSVDDIRVRVEAESYLYAYYYGNTSGGYFNDETGNSYMVYFFEDGTVKQLYVGNFVDGTYEDNTGNAWFILREEDTDYMFFKGCFSGGRHLRDKNHKFESLGPPLSLDEISEIIAERKFNVELNWSEEAFH